MALIDRARDVYFDRAKERWKQEGFYADITDILEDYRAETNKKIKRDKVNVLSTFLISLYDYDHDSLQLDITKLIVLSPSREFPAKDNSVSLFLSFYAKHTLKLQNISGVEPESPLNKGFT